MAKPTVTPSALKQLWAKYGGGAWTALLRQTAAASVAPTPGPQGDALL